MKQSNISELALRCQKIQAAIVANAADACLISTNVNILYAAGRILSGFVYIPAQGKPWFFVRRPVGVEGENVQYIRKPEQISEILQANGIALPEVLMMEGDEISYGEWLRYEAIFAPKKTINCTNILRVVRSVKTDFELTQLKESARLQTAAYNQIPSLYQPGMTDHEFTVEIERSMRLHGCLGMFRIFGSSMEAFMGSVLAGDNADAPSAYDFALGGLGLHPSLPIGHNGTKLEKGMSVMVDMGGNFNGYMSDQTRTFSIGKLTDKAYKAHQVSIEIQERLSELTVPGAVCEELYQQSLDIAAKNGLSDCFMGMSQQAKFVGHGVGLVVNELPVLCDRNKTLIEPNMVIALEPKFIIKGVGAVGTENTYIVRQNGLEKITAAPEEIIEL